MSSNYVESIGPRRPIDWRPVIWLLILSAIFWGGLVCSGRIGLDAPTRPSELETKP